MFVPPTNWWIYSIVSIVIILLYYIYIKTKSNIIEKPDILQELPEKKWMHLLFNHYSLFMKEKAVQPINLNTGEINQRLYIRVAK